MVPDKKLHCNAVKKEPGGGGINVSRVIKRFGGDTTAIYLSGGYTGDFFTKMLLAEQVDVMEIKTVNHTRENFVVVDAFTKLQYRFGMPGPFIYDDEWNKCLDAAASFRDKNVAFMVASGSLTNGIPVDFFAKLALIAKQQHSKFILDTSGDALKAALEQGVYMIKPNLGELSFLAGTSELDGQSAVEAARSLIQKKQCEVVVISMGPRGAMMVTADEVIHVNSPAVKVRSTVGAGDSMVAGIVLSLTSGHTMHEAMQYGVACGTATTMNAGTALCQKADAASLFEMIKNH